MFHQNNTGSVTLEIVEVAQPAPQHFVVRENGRVEWVSAAPATV